MKIWKFPIPVLAGQFGILMPGAAKVISTGLAIHKNTGRLSPHVWAEVEPDELDVIIDIMVVWTGVTDVPLDYRFIGTIIMDDGNLVQHVYAKDGA